MKKWLFTAAIVGFLTACGDEEPIGPAIEKVEPNEDVQSVIDMTADEVYASLIYSEENTSYLLVNAKGKIAVQTETSEDTLRIYITEEDATETVEDVVYAFTLDKPYETIRTFVNDKEIQFDVWYE